MMDTGDCGPLGPYPPFVPLPMRRIPFLLFLFFGGSGLLALPATQAGAAVPSPSFAGPLGLNTVPDARVEETGTLRLQTGTLDPYAHITLGLQIAKPLYIGIRQTAEASGLLHDPIRLYPGIDVKLRLLEESAWSPAIAIGINSAIGQKRMASEYLVFSKRHDRFDFTAGIGWGRLADSGPAINPFRLLGRHFGERRNPDDRLPGGPQDWFTGKKIGFFGGFSYDVPFLDNLTFKADVNADRHSAERAAFDFKAPAPWSAGLNYAPASWVNLGLGLAGTDKVMASISLQTPLSYWPGRRSTAEKPEPVPIHRVGSGSPHEMETAAQAGGAGLYDARSAGATVWGKLDLDPFGASTPEQIGRAGRAMAAHGGETIEELQITPTMFGLRGTTVSLMREPLERAAARNEGSPQEIWRHTKLDAEPPEALEDRYALPALAPVDEYVPFLSSVHGRLVLATQTSLSEQDSGILYRTSLVGDLKKKLTPHMMAGFSLRLNIGDNLSRLRKLRPPAAQPVRSDVDRFAAARVGIDRLYTAWTTSLTPSVHVAFSTGWLEEMYYGANSEILYRPFGENYAFGADAATVFRRDPGTAMGLGLVAPLVSTAHLNAWYELPDSDMTFAVQIGRYLAEDVGGSLSLTRRFAGGASLKAFVTATDQADLNVFGGITHVYSGLEFTLPLGGHEIGGVGTDHMEARLLAAQLGRESGQSLDPPLPLYEITEPLSARHLTRNWPQILD